MTKIPRSARGVRYLYTSIACLILCLTASTPAYSLVTYVAKPGRNQDLRQELGDLGVLKCSSQIELRRQYLISTGFNPRDDHLYNGINEILGMFYDMDEKDLTAEHIRNSIKGYNDLLATSSRNPDNATVLRVGLCMWDILLARAEGRGSTMQPSTPTPQPIARSENTPSTASSYTLRPAKVRQITAPSRQPSGALDWTDEAIEITEADFVSNCGQLFGPWAASAGIPASEAREAALGEFARLQAQSFKNGQDAVIDHTYGWPQAELPFRRCSAEVALGHLTTARPAGSLASSLPTASTQTAAIDRKQVDTGNYSECLTPMMPGEDPDAGNFGGFRNSCPFAVSFVMCVQDPEESSWGTAVDCNKPLKNLDIVGANDRQASHVTGGKRVHWFGCKRPANPKEPSFDQTKIVAYCES